MISVSGEVFSETKMVILEKPGKYRGQDTTLKVRIIESLDSDFIKVQHSHYEDGFNPYGEEDRLEIMHKCYETKASFWSVVSRETKNLEKM